MVTRTGFKRTKSRSYETLAQNEDGDGIQVLDTHKAMGPHGLQAPCAEMCAVLFRGVAY